MHNISSRRSVHISQCLHLHSLCISYFRASPTPPVYPNLHRKVVIEPLIHIHGTRRAYTTFGQNKYIRRWTTASVWPPPENRANELHRPIRHELRWRESKTRTPGPTGWRAKLLICTHDGRKGYACTYIYIYVLCVKGGGRGAGAAVTLGIGSGWLWVRMLELSTLELFCYIKPK